MKQLLEVQAVLITDPPPAAVLDSNAAAVKLISAASSLGNPRHAWLVFSSLSRPNLVAWNSLLKCLSDNGLHSLVISHFNSLLLLRPLLLPDPFTFTSIIRSCAALRSFSAATASHAFLISHGFASNLFVANALLCTYFKLGRPGDARNLLDEMPIKDIVSWNTVIASCPDVAAARCLFDSLPERTLVTWSSMITVHSRAGDLPAARQLFDKMPQRNSECWNAMISGYSCNGRYRECLDLFCRMLAARQMPDTATLVIALSACAHLGALASGRWIHRYIQRRGLQTGLFLGNALADMYAKCGCIPEAVRVFGGMRDMDVVSWTILISGLATSGRSAEAVSAFRAMLRQGIGPNGITFVAVLSACSHSGLVGHGIRYFNMMKEELRIAPKVVHFGCVVDLLSRAGRLQEAEDIISSMGDVRPNAAVWGALLGGCFIHGDAGRGQKAARRIQELDSTHSGSYVYLAAAHISSGRLEEAANCWVEMRRRGAAKAPGCSWTEAELAAQECFSRDLRRDWRAANYAPNTAAMSQGVGEEEKEDAVLMHTARSSLSPLPSSAPPREGRALGL